MAGVLGEQIARQAASFRPEDQTITTLESGVRVGTFRPGSQIPEPRVGKLPIKCFDIDMTMEFHMFPIVEARTPQRPVVHPESGHSDYVEDGLGRGTKPGDVARIWRNLRFE